MIACVDCGRVLLETAVPSLMSTREHKAHVAAQVRTARNLHTCKSTGGFMPTTDHCDTVAELVEQGIATLEEAASVIGCPAPSLHIHLVQHDRDDLLRRMTYGGEPILEPVAGPEPVAAAPEPDVEEVEERSCQCDKWVFDDGEEDFEEPNDAGVGTIVHTEQACYQREPLPAAVEVPEEWAAEVETLTQAETDVPPLSSLRGAVPHYHTWVQRWVCECGDQGDPPEDDVVDAEILDVDPLDSVAALVAHDDPEVREAAAALQVLIARRRQDWMLQAELERLTVERDHLTARIEELRAALAGDAAPVAPVAEVPRRGQPTTAEIRAWCIAHDVLVPSRGTLPRTAIEAYEAAHEVSA